MKKCSKKKILFITAFPPNEQTAGQNYSMNLINDLSSTHQVDIIYWGYEKHSISKKIIDRVNVLKEYSVNMKVLSIIWSVILFLFPFFTVRFNLAALGYIHRIYKHYDILYFDFSQVFVYSLFLSHSCKIMMCHDVISQKYTRDNRFYIYKWWINNSEKRLLNTAKRILCFSEKDRSLISTNEKIVEVVSFYIDNKILDIQLETLGLGSFFCFYGAWNRNENLSGLLWFINKVLPLCDSDIVFKIIGGGMPLDVKKIIEKKRNISYLGFVENPYSIIVQSKALLAPLFSGAGVKVKVIESLALGTPVIGTNIAFEGIMRVDYANNKNAQVLFSSAENMATLINNFQISQKEKVDIRNTFLSKYGSRKFIHMMNL
ncbi:glycosyltransferase [uncultured Bacteroides sp.]|uniref:glycosyltransferase n=1 Tax=uncultured Bacteroides sp. TaxID=162156 RepID=UPI002618777B|nr:glycosyltransferase [uncultured Bacteroides sp.]